MDEVKKAMNVLGITEINTEYAYVKKVHKKLLVKWHPDSCPDGKTEEYTKKSAEINAAFDVLTKAYDLGMMGPGAKEYSESTSTGKTDSTKTNNNYSYTNNTNRTANSTKQSNTGQNGSSNAYSSNSSTNSTNSYSNNYQSYSSYNSYSYHNDWMERQRKEREVKYSSWLIHNGIWTFIFYAICFKYIYGALTEVDLELRNMLIKEAPYNFSVLIVVFYLIKLFLLQGEESDIKTMFYRIVVPVAFMFPIIYTFMHGSTAATVFGAYFATWAVLEWYMDVIIYAKTDGLGIKTTKGKKITISFIFFAAEEVIVIVFGIYVAISAIFIK